MNRQCCGIETEFDDRVARRELRTLRKRGPRRTTLELIDGVGGSGVRGETALDIGGGVGAIQLALCEAGIDNIISIDASPAYVSVAKQEADRRGFSDRVTYIDGDFVEVADDIKPADIVTLDRVICCYDDARSLVEKSATKAKRVYGIVYPRVTPLSRIVFAGINLMMSLRRSEFRGFLHDSTMIDEIIIRAGLTKTTQVDRLLWQVVVYERQ